jgi:hypothetical protein
LIKGASAVSAESVCSPAYHSTAWARKYIIKHQVLSITKDKAWMPLVKPGAEIPELYIDLMIKIAHNSSAESQMIEM